MAAITANTGVKDKGSSAPVNLTRTTLTASDTLSFVQGAGQVLHLYNTTASIVNVTLVGTAPTTLTPDGYGGTVSTAAGKVVAVPASGWTVVELDDIWAFLTGSGVVTLTNGTGLVAALYT